MHPDWLSDNDRGFDVFVSYFGDQPGRYAEDVEFYESRKGMKWPILGKLLQSRPDLVDRYDYFWLPDDDLMADTATINAMFDFAAAYRLALAQPALTRDSYFTWPLLLQDTRYQLRFTRFVEAMAPLFDRAALLACLPTFSESASGWGLDFLWPGLLAGRGESAIAVIDATPVRHSRPVGGGDLYKKTGMQAALRDKRVLFAKYGLDAGALAETRYYSGGVRQVRRPFLTRMLGEWLRMIRRANYRRLEHRRLQRNG